MRPSQLLAAVVAMSSVSAAMSDAFDNIHGLADVKNVLFGRQDDNSDRSSDTPTSTRASQTSQRPTATESGNNDDDDDRQSTAKTTSGTAKASGSGTKVTTGKPKATSFDPRLPAGGLTMVTPNALEGSKYYRVGDWVTFAWNYTSVSITPTAIDVLASCTANQATYTIAVNMSAKQTEVLWDTGKNIEGQAPFLTENYKLLIYDSDLSVSATPRAGYLGAFSGFTFGMYTPRPYVAIKDGYTCANCNGALSHFEKMTLGTMLFTTGTTVGSLLYFTYQFGLW